MARSVDDIYNEIIAAKEDESSLDSLNSTSSSALWRLWAYITAVAINIHEQLLDTFIDQLEQLARNAVAGTADWLQTRVLEFQYSETSPQVITVVDGVATYPTINESLRIVTRAAVIEQGNNRVLVKAAKGTGILSPLTETELNALKGYLDKIGFVGVPIDTISLNADRLRFEGTIFYSGEYVETSVKTDVIAAINAYLESISIDEFNGQIVREKLIDRIQAVEGVSGIDTLNVLINGRPEQDPLGGPNNISVQRLYETTSGYIIEEDTESNTFEDTITMVLNP